MVRGQDLQCCQRDGIGGIEREHPLETPASRDRIALILALGEMEQQAHFVRIPEDGVNLGWPSGCFDCEVGEILCCPPFFGGVARIGLGQERMEQRGNRWRWIGGNGYLGR